MVYMYANLNACLVAYLPSKVLATKIAVNTKFNTKWVNYP